MDDEKLRKGEGIWPNLVEAIGQSKISIPIFSPRYAESKWCLKELAEIIEHKKREEGHIILPIFYMVDPRDVRNQTGRYEEAFKQHKRNNNFDEKTIETWKAALTKVGSLKGWHIKTKEEEVDVAKVVYIDVWSHLSKNNNKLETNELVGIDDHVQQIEDMLDLGSQGVNLVGLHGMGGIGFASGSRFIATSRDIKVLENLGVGESKIYEVQGMNSIRSLQLFCKHAFKKDSPLSGFEALSEAIVSTTRGLPLTLKIIGSSLHLEEKVVWMGKLEQLRKIPEKKVMESLEISYEGLNPQAREIFLDIACFCIGENKEIASYMWSDCDFYPMPNVNILEQRSMLSIGDDNEFIIHDQLRDMGREIVRRKDKHPWMRSRIWSDEETRKLLLNNKGTDEIQAIRLHPKAEVILKSKYLTNLSELRYFSGEGVKLIGDFNYLLPELKWIRYYPQGYADCKTTINMESLRIVDVSSSAYKLTHMKVSFIRS
ncbi:Disease resistance protein L6 [Linum perenne]